MSATLVIAVTTAFAQRDMGTLLGSVTDPSGAAIPGVAVQITEDATGVASGVQTDSQGNYIRPLLKPGSYTVAVEASGFKRAVQAGVILQSGARVQASFVMEIGQVTEVIEVAAQLPALQTASTQMGGTLESKQTSELPLGGQRRFAFLARQIPAVVPAEPGARDAAGGGFSANGVRSNGQNNFLLNGVDNNVNVIDFINQTAYVIGPSVEAIGEMQILTNGYSAEYGRAAGGVVNVTIKSGTNGLHGTLFGFHQNDDLNANTWEANKNGQEKAGFVQNQFGAAIGGPLIKDRTFWFFDYQGTRIRDGSLVRTLTVPSAGMVNGDFSALLGNVVGTDALGNTVRSGQIFDARSQRSVGSLVNVRDPFQNNIIPESRFDPIAKRLLDQFPAENQNLTAPGSRPGANFFTQRAAEVDVDQWDVRLDHRLSDDTSIFGSLSWSNEEKLQSPPLPGDLDGGGFGGIDEENLGRNAMISATHIWSPTLISETRVAFSRLVTTRTQANADNDTFAELGFGGPNPFTTNNGGLPSINVQGFSSFGGSEWLPTQEFNNVWDFIQNVSWNKGSHAWKFGAEYRQIRFPFFQVPSPRGTFAFQRDQTNQPGLSDTGDGMAAFLLGLPGTGTRITTANFISSFKDAYSFYAQDDWKVTPKLTLNIGLRYELTSPIGEENGRQSNLDITTFGQPTLVIPEGNNQDAPLPLNFATQFPGIAVQRGEADKRLHDWDKTNFAPRIGLAYQVSPTTVVRAAYGIFYGAEENEGGDPNRGENPPFNQEVGFTPARSTDLNPFIDGFSDGFPVDSFSLPANIRFRGSNPTRDWPLIHKWSFNVQRDIGFNTVVELGYVGSKGQRLTALWDANRAINSPDLNSPTADRRPIQELGNNSLTIADNFGWSEYHAFTAKVEKRLSNGLQFLNSYTWGHALTDVGTTLSGGPGLRTRDVAAEWSHANFDIRHRFTSSFLWELPFGRGRKFGTDFNRTLDLIAGGWQVNGIVTLQSGNFFNLGTNQAVGSFGTVRPDVVAGQDPNDAPAGGRGPDLFFDIGAVTAPTAGTFGNLGNFSNQGPPIYNTDLSFFKDFSIAERYRLQYRAEAFNLFNNPKFNNPGSTQGAGDFGVITSTRAGSQRQWQMALRFMF